MSVSSANNEISGNFYLKDSFPWPDFSERSVTSYQQPHLPFSNNNRFGIGIKIVLSAIALIRNSTSLYLETNRVYYDH